MIGGVFGVFLKADDGRCWCYGIVSAKDQRHGTSLMTYNGISGGYMIGESRIVSSARRRRWEAWHVIRRSISACTMIAFQTFHSLGRDRQHYRSLETLSVQRVSPRPRGVLRRLSSWIRCSYLGVRVQGRPEYRFFRSGKSEGCWRESQMPVTSKYDNALHENPSVSGLLWTRLTMLGQWNSIKKLSR